MDIAAIMLAVQTDNCKNVCVCTAVRGTRVFICQTTETFFNIDCVSVLFILLSYMF